MVSIHIINSPIPTDFPLNIVWLHTDLIRHFRTPRICYSYHCYRLGNRLTLCWHEINFPVKHEGTGTWKITLGLVSNPGLITSLNFNQTEVNSSPGNKPELQADFSQLWQPSSGHPTRNNIFISFRFPSACTNLALFCVPFTWLAAWGTCTCFLNHSGNYM
jgi:hypothetical protein